MKQLIPTLWSLLILFTGCQKVEENVQLLVNHTGYSVQDNKRVVLQTTAVEIPVSFRILDSEGNAVFEGIFEEGGRVDGWHTGKAYAADFSEFRQKGTFTVVTELNGETYQSRPFPIDEQTYKDKALELLIEGFESQHITGAFDARDRQMTFFGDRKDTVDVHGGWYDASGDRAKYLSHLSYANYLNPQQTPLWVWTLMESESQYARNTPDASSELRRRLLEEAAYGADFLVRMLDPEGYFYLTVFAQWSGLPERRLICAYTGQDGKMFDDYQAAFREGGGMAVAALARASKTLTSGEYPLNVYLEAAEKGFEHLLENSISYTDDGQENIIDDYCALMASTELYSATGKADYLDYARNRMERLVNRLRDNEEYQGWWSADQEGKRPYFHASDAGLPLISINRYLQFEEDTDRRNQAIEAIQKSINFELSITEEVFNPFGYPRQYVKAVDEAQSRGAFFIPHQNESGYWWQGENARLASLATAFYLNTQYMTSEQQTRTDAYTSNIMNWILGLNPFDICMLDGLGYNNPEYLEPTDLNFRGGVANGITAGFTDETDIAYMPAPYDQDPAQRWRWAEQWMPHGAWLMLAVTSER
jgi:hypothetical protein